MRLMVLIQVGSSKLEMRNQNMTMLTLVTGEFPEQRPVTQSFDVFFDLGPSQQLSKQLRRRLFETPLRSLWRHCTAYINFNGGW